MKKKLDNQSNEVIHNGSWSGFPYHNLTVHSREGPLSAILGQVLQLYGLTHGKHHLYLVKTRQDLSHSGKSFYLYTFFLQRHEISSKENKFLICLCGIRVKPTFKVGHIWMIHLFTYYWHIPFVVVQAGVIIFSLRRFHIKSMSILSTIEMLLSNVSFNVYTVSRKKALNKSNMT